MAYSLNDSILIKQYILYVMWCDYEMLPQRRRLLTIQPHLRFVIEVIRDYVFPPYFK